MKNTTAADIVGKYVASARAELAETIETHVRPSPETIDETARLYLSAQKNKANAQAIVTELEEQLIKMVTDWGIVPAHAEKSRRLKGTLAELTVTHSDVLTIVDERVEMLKDCLYVQRLPASSLASSFKLRSKWEVVEGAEAALKAETLPKRLSEKVLNLWGRCIGVKPKKPSLRVVVTDLGQACEAGEAVRPKRRIYVIGDEAEASVLCCILHNSGWAEPSGVMRECSLAFVIAAGMAKSPSCRGRRCANARPWTQRGRGGAASGDRAPQVLSEDGNDHRVPAADQRRAAGQGDVPRVGSGLVRNPGCRTDFDKPQA